MTEWKASFFLAPVLNTHHMGRTLRTAYCNLSLDERGREPRTPRTMFNLTGEGWWGRVAAT
eukprot:5574433-Prymnesium_polylepis.1